MPRHGVASFYIRIMKRLLLAFAVSFLFAELFAQNNLEISWQNCYGGSNGEGDQSIVQTGFGYFVLCSTGSSDGDITNYWGGGDLWLAAVDSMGNFLWGRCYGGTSWDYATNIIADGLGYYYLGGATLSNNGDIKSGNHGSWDRWVVKIDESGHIIWEKCYGGTGIEYGGLIKLLSDGRIIVFGASTSGDGDVPVNYGYLDVWITIIDPENGDILQNRVFGNSDQNNIFDIVETRDGGFFFTSGADGVGGMVQGNYHGGGDVWAVKTDANLNIEWQQLYGGSSIDYQGQSILELDDGYVFLANTVSNDGDVSGFHGIVGDLATNDIWVVRIDTIGHIIWQKCLGGSKIEYGSKLFQSDDGGFVVFGHTDSNDGDVWDLHTSYNKQNDDIWMVKLSSEGEIEWSRCYGGVGGENIWYNSVLKKAEDNYIIAGSTYPFTSPSGNLSCNPKGSSDIWLFEIKECANYMPAIPQSPTGPPDTLCITSNRLTRLDITPASGAWSYEWQVVPQGAGTFFNDSTSATIQWTPGWEGQAEISVRSLNDCGHSAWSQPKNIWAYSCLGITSPSLVPRPPYLIIFPNPAGNTIYFKYQLSNISCQLSIYDIFGRKQDEIIIPKGQEQVRVDVSGYPAGVYMAVLNDETGVVAREKFVKH
jgi:hypothetical protein